MSDVFPWGMQPMIDSLNNEDVSTAVSELVTCFGVREDIPFDRFAALLRKKDRQACAQEIASQLGLPIRITLTCAPQSYKPGQAVPFETSALVRVDRSRPRSIVAQVGIAEQLPMFGTTALDGYPVQVRVSENCHQHLHAFVAMMAHELSHVLLASVRHPRRQSELHADLLPLLLGFRDIVRTGRKRVERNIYGDVTATSTYGYLEDAQFEFAYSHVTSILNKHTRSKKHLLRLAVDARSKLKKAEHTLAKFREYFELLDRRPPIRMRPEHARRAVQLHSRDHTVEWERHIRVVCESVSQAESFAQGVHHYTSEIASRLNAETVSVRLALDGLQAVVADMANDVRMLGKYVSLFHKFRRLLHLCA